MSRPAVFLDRDGTLIEDRGAVADPAQAVLFPETVGALRRLDPGFLLFIVTNQGWIGQGRLRAEDAARVNEDLVRRLGVPIAGVYVCPHAEAEGCGCRKPKPHFARRAEREHGVDLARSWVVGDHPSDVEFAAGVGARGIYVLTGHGAKHRAEPRPAGPEVAGISEAVDLIATARGAEVLREGGLVAFPTETVYGLGADASNPAAVRRIFAVKGRPERHPLIVHVGGAERIGDWAAEVPEAARRLAERFWPGPLTMVLRKAARVPAEVTGGQETIGLRVPAHPLALGLLREFGGGVAAPSANRFGRVSPTTAGHVRDDLGGEVDFVVDGGPCAVGVESTIVDLTGEGPVLLRPGGVPREEIEGLLGVRVPVRAGGPVRVSGQLESHYAPRAEVIVVRPEELTLRAKEWESRGVRVAVLDRPLAPELYLRLREADAQGAGVVLVTLPEEGGLGAAIIDRLRKASAPRKC